MTLRSAGSSYRHIQHTADSMQGFFAQTIAAAAISLRIVRRSGEFPRMTQYDGRRLAAQSLAV
jgi:hypothetical protein